MLQRLQRTDLAHGRRDDDGLSYDPAGQLYQTGSTRFLYDGEQVVGGVRQIRRPAAAHISGLGLDSIVTDYEGSGYDRRWLLANERGSVVSVTDGLANALTTNTYDEYGVPGPGNSGRLQYTGQMWLRGLSSTTTAPGSS